ncbi:MAG TPA: tetratricopeptide repeat protein [Steroidobacteraceae bacterium]|jgi:tetratricopeptide (TPR) repeat protein
MSESGTISPDYVAMLTEAQALMERRRYMQARSVISQALRHFPDSSDFQYLGAFLEYATEDYAAATRSADAVLARDPQHYGARVLRANLHEQAKEYPSAERLWIELLREYPENPDCYAAYAELMLRTLHLEKARLLAEEGLRHSPEHQGCLYVATLADFINSPGSAQSDNLRKLLQAHPEHVGSSMALLIALADQGRNREALRIAQELLRQQPDSAQLVQIVRALKVQTHWSMIPMYPMQRWGWGGAVAVTAAGMIGLRVAGTSLPASIVTPLALIWLGYCLYTWTWPSILRKLI